MELTQKQANQVAVMAFCATLLLTAFILFLTGDKWTSMGFIIAAMSPAWGTALALMLWGLGAGIWYVTKAFLIAFHLRRPDY